MAEESNRIWLCELVRIDELELECETKQVYFAGDTENNFSDELCKLFDFSKETSFKLFNSDGHCLPLSLLVKMLNASGGVSQLQKVKVLEDDSGPVRLNIRFQKPSDKPAAGAKQKAAKPAAESDDEEEEDDEEGVNWSG
jgi:hypothetical protein